MLALTFLENQKCDLARMCCSRPNCITLKRLKEISMTDDTVDGLLPSKEPKARSDEDFGSNVGSTSEDETESSDEDTNSNSLQCSNQEICYDGDYNCVGKMCSMYREHVKKLPLVFRHGGIAFWADIDDAFRDGNLNNYFDYVCSCEHCKVVKNLLRNTGVAIRHGCAHINSEVYTGRQTLPLEVWSCSCDECAIIHNRLYAIDLFNIQFKHGGAMRDAKTAGIDFLDYSCDCQDCWNVNKSTHLVNVVFRHGQFKTAKALTDNVDSVKTASKSPEEAESCTCGPLTLEEVVALRERISQELSETYIDTMVEEIVGTSDEEVTLSEMGQFQQKLHIIAKGEATGSLTYTIEKELPKKYGLCDEGLYVLQKRSLEETEQCRDNDVIVLDDDKKNDRVVEDKSSKSRENSVFEETEKWDCDCDDCSKARYLIDQPAIHFKHGGFRLFSEIGEGFDWLEYDCDCDTCTSANAGFVRSRLLLKHGYCRVEEIEPPTKIDETIYNKSDSNCSCTFCCYPPEDQIKDIACPECVTLKNKDYLAELSKNEVTVDQPGLCSQFEIDETCPECHANNRKIVYIKCGNRGSLTRYNDHIKNAVELSCIEFNQFIHSPAHFAKVLSCRLGDRFGSAVKLNWACVDFKQEKEMIDYMKDFRLLPMENCGFCSYTNCHKTPPCKELFKESSEDASPFTMFVSIDSLMENHRNRFFTMQFNVLPITISKPVSYYLMLSQQKKMTFDADRDYESVQNDFLKQLAADDNCEIHLPNSSLSTSTFPTEE